MTYGFITTLGDDLDAARAADMSLRDWLAGCALQGFLADGSQRLVAQAIEASEAGQHVNDTVALANIVNTEIATGIYRMADAMLRARKASS